ncbi:MAG: hypothetical protein KDC80_29305 [Saprospiraceae bacterium]|nr:hypothetical protein [Saprospiraceae bacterium]
MNTIHIRKFGLAVGLTWVLLYLGCAIVMLVVGREGTALFFNSLLHGLETASIIRMDVPFYEFCIGLAESFILGWLVGACIAGIYNFSLNKKWK